MKKKKDLFAATISQLLQAPADLPNPVRPDEWEYYLPLKGSTMFECGGKVNSNVPDHPGEWITYKSYFVALGFRHVSVDFDMRWADFKRDLRLPLWDELGQFDMVCDIGTGEHVEGQAGFWANIHNLTKVGGVYVGQHPAPTSESWWWHGIHYPTEQFYQSFAELNGWEIERMGRGLKAQIGRASCRERV
jgi:hypothetical protein